MKYKIGDEVTDDNEFYKGVICILWDDGDISTIENTEAHPNPHHLTSHSSRAAKRGASDQTQGYIEVVKKAGKEVRKPPPA